MSTRGWSEQGGKIGGKNERAVVIALLVERSLPIPEVHSSGRFENFKVKFKLFDKQK